MIKVFGSINADLVVSVDRLPKPGETVLGPDHQLFAGGKGANQALAAALCGAAVSLVGAVGDDPFAGPALANLKAADVDLSRVRTLEGATGLAFIAVASDGAAENQIVVASGVNRRAEASWLDERDLASSKILLMQLELPLAAVWSAATRAREAGVPVMLNAAPASRALGQDLFALADILVVNENEARAVAHKDGSEAVWSPETFARHCVSSGCRLAIVTLGSEGCIAADAGRMYRVAPPHIDVVDTTGAGDAFIGALAAALDRGSDTTVALREAVAAGTIACTRTGAQAGLPNRAEVDAYAARICCESSAL